MVILDVIIGLFLYDLLTALLPQERKHYLDPNGTIDDDAIKKYNEMVKE